MDETDYSTESLNLKARILVPIAVALIFFVAVFVYTMQRYHKIEIDHMVDATAATVNRLLDEKLKVDAAFMHEVIEMLEYDPELKRALQRRDRAALLEKSAHHFKRMNLDHRITHFYFTGADRINILRVHKPDRYGDRIDRFTTMEAELSGKSAYGIELGPLGTFTLRVVIPWYLDGELIGFVELGEEIEHIIEGLGNVTQAELQALIDKRFLDRARWETGMKMLGRNGEWDTLPSSVIVFQSLDNDLSSLEPYLAKWKADGFKDGSLEVSMHNRKYLGTVLPLLDAGKGRVGDLLVFRDVTEQYGSAVRATIINGITGFALGGILMILLYGISSRMERKLEKSQLELVREAKERQAMQEQHIDELQHLAMHDAMTGLSNRNFLHGRLEEAIPVSIDGGKPLALFVVVIRRFKEINDTLGHRNGDKLLWKAGSRLSKEFPECAAVARIGADALGMMFHPFDREDTTSVIQRISDSFESPFLIDEFNLNVETATGVAFAPEHGEDPDTIIQRADVASRLAKRDSASFALYEAERDPYSRKRLAFISELKDAISKDELKLYYQPKVDMKSGLVRSVEALLRWQHPQHGLVPPNDFIPLAESTDLIHPLTEWVVGEAIRQCIEWKRAGLDLGMAVNLSVRNIENAKFPAFISDLLERSGMEPSLLTLEITESAIMTDPHYASEVLSQLKGMGMSISIDDFGTGYSSLSYLSRLPVSTIKVDRSFVSGINEHDNDMLIVRSTIELGRSLGLRVIAEGVENKDAWSKLEAMGCDMIQGYYISPPLPAGEFERWLSESEWQCRGMEKGKS